VKESKSNQELSGRTGSFAARSTDPDGRPSGSSNQRDPWTMLQSQLGLISSPIEQEQVSVVSTAEESETDDLQQQEVSQDEIPSFRQAVLPIGVPTDTVAGRSTDSVAGRSTDTVAGRSTDTVTVNILVPTTSAQESDSRDAKPDDPFGFSPLDNCDIPKNAFASPRKSKAFRKTGEVAPSPVEAPQDRSEKQDILPSEVGPGTSEAPIDPLQSDELPTSLWQPRKSASASKSPTPTPAATPSFSDTLNDATVSKAEGRKKEWSGADRTAPQVTVPPPTDDLARHSSGNQRHERSGGRQEKSLDRRSREPMQEMSYRDRREHSRNVPDNQVDVADNPVETQFDELAWEPKPTSRGKNRETRKSFRQTDVPSFAEREDVPQRFGSGPDRGNDDNDWLDAGLEIEPAPPRSKQNRQQQSSFEKPEKREKFDKDAKNAYEAERILARRAKEEQVREARGESSPRPSATPKRAETPGKEKAAGTSTQKIAVFSWNDAVQDIIEKNMQRRPASATKNDRDRRNGGGRGHRR